MLVRSIVTRTPSDVIDRDIIARLLTLTRANGGATLSPRTGNAPDPSGYMVGGLHSAYIVKGWGDRRYSADEHDQLIDKITRHVQIWSANLFGKTYTYLGAWLHNGDLYIDLSERYLGLELAAAVGRERGEIAIFSLEKGRDITL